MEEVDYRAFLRDLKKLCKRHGVKVSACNEGFVGVGPATAKTVGEFPFSYLRVDPKAEVAVLGDSDEKPINM